MTQFPKRTEHTNYSNKVPIADMHEALELLMMDGSSTDPYHLTNRKGIWEIVLPWYHEGSSGGDSSGFDYFQIDQELAKRLVDERKVEPRRKMRWGATDILQNELVPTRAAVRDEEVYRREMQAHAKSLLVVGLHTDLSGEAVSNGWGREEWRYGRMYFDFKMPNDNICRVYPESDEVVAPYPPPKTAAA